MKKGIIILGLLLSIVGCQSKEVETTPEENKPAQATTLKTGQTYTIKDTLEFEVIQNQVTDVIEPSNKNQDYKKIQAKGNQLFLDVIMKVSNLTDKEMELKNIFAGIFKVGDERYQVRVVIESTNYNQLSTTDTLKADQTRYIHVYCEASEDQIKTEAVLDLGVYQNENNYTYTFSTEIEENNGLVKSIGDVLKLKNSEITLKAINQTKKIEPSNKGIFYSFIPTDKTDETFVTLQIEMKNTSESALKPEEYIYCEYQVDGKIIKSEIIMESENNKAVAKGGDITSLGTRIIYLAMPVSDNLLNKDAKIQLFVEGNTFNIQE